MVEELITHVPPSKLWQCVSGGTNLQQRDYEHVIGCVACEKLITEIAEALDDIASKYPGGNASLS